MKLRSGDLECLRRRRAQTLLNIRTRQGERPIRSTTTQRDQNEQYIKKPHRIDNRLKCESAPPRIKREPQV